MIRVTFTSNHGVQYFYFPTLESANEWNLEVRLLFVATLEGVITANLDGVVAGYDLSDLSNYEDFLDKFDAFIGKWGLSKIPHKFISIYLMLEEP